MKLTKKSQKAIPKKRGRKPRPAIRYIDQRNQISYIDQFNETLNNGQSFTYLDYERNKNFIEVIRKHYQQMIKMYGLDLVYFRKFNTFFKDEEYNKANMIYGEDSTAEFYASGYVRAFLDISTYNWLFNSMGYEAQENINLYIGIEDFRARFATLFGKLKTERFYVPVTGNTRFNELTGIIDCPEFYATIYGKFPDNLYAYNIYPIIQERPMNSTLYKSLTHKTTLYPLTGCLNGQLYLNDQYPMMCSGIISGDLTYHCYQNIEDSPAWQIAPQVGDFFNLKIGDIEQEYQIIQVFDRILQNQGGINPLLGKYIFQVQATRRNPSHEEFNDIQNQQKQISEEDILDELNSAVKQSTEQEETKIPNYAEQNQNEKSELNKQSNNIANGIYDYKSEKDEDHFTYGGY